MKISKLQKRMGDFFLDIEEMTLEPGKVHGLAGPNGSGKTTLCKLIAGVLEPDGGSLDYEGLTHREVTMTSQKPYMLHDTVLENLLYPLKIRGQRPDREEVRRWLERCGLQGKEEQYARSLSSGEQQKLSFIRAMIFHPRLILVDETLSNLDPDSAGLFEELILEQQRREPVTWVIISHQLAHICRICDQVHFMEQGKLLVQGTPEEILLSPSHPAVQRFLSETEVSYRKNSP